MKAVILLFIAVPLFIFTFLSNNLTPFFLKITPGELPDFSKPITVRFGNIDLPESYEKINLTFKFSPDGKVEMVLTSENLPSSKYYGSYYFVKGKNGYEVKVVVEDKILGLKFLADKVVYDGEIFLVGDWSYLKA